MCIGMGTYVCMGVVHQGGCVCAGERDKGGSSGSVGSRYGVGHQGFHIYINTCIHPPPHPSVGP